MAQQRDPDYKASSEVIQTLVNEIYAVVAKRKGSFLQLSVEDQDLIRLRRVQLLLEAQQVAKRNHRDFNVQRAQWSAQQQINSIVDADLKAQALDLWEVAA